MNKDIKKLLENVGILPVINISEKEYALPLVNALIDGGMKALEVTLRSDNSLQAIKTIKHEYPNFVVGAGTVINTNLVDEALNAGADFIVCPGYDEEIVDYLLKKGVPIVPGCTTPSEIQKAVKNGLKVLKFFPSELSGGISAIKLVSGAFPQVKFIPTGGINFDNLSSYLSNDKVLACGGSYMATADQLKKCDYVGITENCKKALAISLGFELAHVGINCYSEEEADNGANMFSEIFKFNKKAGNSSIFSGTAVEFMKTKYYGTNGHIGIKTNSVKRAIAYFEDNGYEIIKESIKEDSKGLVSAYLKEEIGGFAVHVVRK